MLGTLSELPLLLSLPVIPPLLLLFLGSCFMTAKFRCLSPLSVPPPPNPKKRFFQLGHIISFFLYNYIQSTLRADSSTIYHCLPLGLPGLLIWGWALPLSRERWGRTISGSQLSRARSFSYPSLCFPCFFLGGGVVVITHNSNVRFKPRSHICHCTGCMYWKIYSCASYSRLSYGCLYANYCSLCRVVMDQF